MTRGEDNPQAQLTDDEVEMIRALRDSEAHLPRHKRHWTAPLLAAKFEISTRQVWNILSYKQRVLSADSVDNTSGVALKPGRGDFGYRPGRGDSLKWLTASQLKANARSGGKHRRAMAKWKHEETPPTEREKIPRVKSKPRSETPEESKDES